MEKPLGEAVEELQLLLNLAISRLTILDLKYRIFGPVDPLDYMTDRLEFSIYDPRSPGSQLLRVVYKCDDGTIRLIKHRTEELTSKYRGKVVSPDWVAKFCNEHGGHAREPINVLNSETNTCYVYQHIFKNGSIYVGKGKNDRWIDFQNGRNFEYRRLLDKYGEPLAALIETQLSDGYAYKLEAKLIAALRTTYGIRRVVNRTGGLENADIGDMPIETCYRLNDFQEPDLKGSRYDVCLNLYREFYPKGTGRQYHKSMPLFDAAKLLKCTMNELLVIAGSDRPEIDGFQLLSDLEMKLALEG